MEVQELTYDEKLKFVTVIAQPIAGKKLAKKIYKLIKKASKEKGNLRNGIKDVQSKIRKGERGLVIIAGNVTPLDVITHMPAVCESKDIPYCYTPSRHDLGNAMGVRRGTLIVLIKPTKEYKELYDECLKEIESLPTYC
ncbi:hypothetical protein AAG570_006700 [Ranatra chinensis]|uniref:Ribosomal protein eL8/eL30/eS12/Gadd45 domain-containing protein n=1 Tax=Ranatra chinensis TaxID=642074 RepID=A0ABD0Z5C3_9HEMI